MLERFDVVGVIGRGATAVVYRAHDRVLDRPVALKEIVGEDKMDLALAEARAVARISHPNVVTIHDIISEQQRFLIAMELLEGPTLRGMLESGPLPLPALDAIGRQIASSLAASHHAGVIHRDIKPDNIFVLPGGRVVVTDFGLSMADVQGGTPGYMSPEQWKGRSLTTASDIFSWGCVMLECASGVAPFGVDPVTAEYRTCFEEPPIDTSWRALDDLLRRCLHKDPARRPRDGAELAELLDRLPVREQNEDRYAAFRSRPAQAVPALRLRVVGANGERSRIEVTSSHTEVGREAEILIDDPLVSRRHLAIDFEQHTWTFTDLGSSNGTFRNGESVLRGSLHSGDVLSIGATTVHVE